MIARARSLYRRVKRQNIGLESDTIDKGNNFRHLQGTFGYRLHVVSNLPH